MAFVVLTNLSVTPDYFPSYGQAFKAADNSHATVKAVYKEVEPGKLSTQNAWTNGKFWEAEQRLQNAFSFFEFIN